jgi:DNA-binding response OmpR family regulator/anti-sigma regulatory factor (Ser/Thr protein kinase)
MAIAKETIALNEVVSEAVEIVRGLAEARGLRLELDLPTTPVWLELDRTRIRQVLLNLLTNAMRYTEAGYVRVAVQLEANQVIIAVEDSGRGISPEHLTRAFEAFSRLDEQDLRDGSGLGLAVSKKFVELHGGTMSIESELNRGTKVSFSLPLLDHTALLARPYTASGRPLGNGSRQPVVLVLHDDRRILDLLQRHIGTCSFVLTDSPAQVGRLIQEQLPTLILMGATWAEGYGAAQDIQALLSQIPVITCPLPSMHTLGRHLGATDYLPKPVLREDLAASLARLPRRPQTALIVDDDPHVVRLIVRMLAAIDPAIQVREAFGGEAGLAIARSQRPDVIFLDLVMPQLNGYRLMEEISADQSLAHTAVIVVSVRSVDQESARLPGELWLRRPNGFSLTEVLQTLNVMLASITQPDGASPTSAAAQLEIAAG